MEFRHLTSFLALAEELHFGKAASRLHLTQPSLSQQLKRLERSLGVELVARSSHNVRLTAAGRAFEAEARTVLLQVNKAATAAQEAAAGRAGTLTVGYNFLAGQHVLPTTLARMHAELPGVSVALEEKRTGPQLAALAQGAIDVALVYGRPVASGFECRRLLQVPMVAVVGPHHKFAGRRSVPFSELAGQPCVFFERAQCPAMYDAILTAAERSGIALDVAHVLDDPGATAILVSVKPLVGFASASRGLFVGSAAGGIRPSPVRLYEPVPVIDLYAVWRRDNHDPVTSSFLQYLDEVGPFEAPPGRLEAVAGR